MKRFSRCVLILILVAILSGVSGYMSIEIEPFHPLGESKYSALGREVADIPVPSGKTVDKWIKQIGCGTDKDVICAYQA